MLADTLKSIVAVAEKIYGIIKLVQENQAQLKNVWESVTYERPQEYLSTPSPR